MKRKMARVVSLFLTTAMLGSSVPSVVLAEDFSEQPEVQWDSEAVETASETEGQDPVTDAAQEDASTDDPESADLMPGEDFVSDEIQTPDEPQTSDGDAQEAPSKDPEENPVVQPEENGEEPEEIVPEQELASNGEEDLSLESEETPDVQLEESGELVSAGESTGVSIIASGNCGQTKDKWSTGGEINDDGSNIQDTAKWTLDSEGTLTISGSGTTTDYMWSVNSYDDLDLKRVQPWAAYDDQIRRVIVEEGITEIGKFNFMKCKNLESVQLPESLEIIKTGAFRRCESLKEIKIPDGVTDIWDDAFAYCEKLETIKLPASLTHLGEAFWSSGLTEIVIPEKIQKIEDQTFGYCEALKKITFSENIKTLGWHAFLGCSSLTDITLPESLETIDNSAFWQCDNLKSVKFGNKLKEIGTCAFERSSLENIVLPESLEVIGERAFSGCNKLTSVKFGNNITKIGNEAFHNCVFVRELILPRNLKELGENVFSTDFCKRIVVYKNLQKIGKYAFGSPGYWLVHGINYNGVAYPATGENTEFYYEGTKAQWEKISNDSFYVDDCIRFHYGTTAYQNQSYKITFNKNAKKATLKTTSKNLKTNSKYGTLPTPSCSGYYFLGWYTKASGGSKVTSSTVFKQTKNQTLYAHWAKADLSKATVTVSRSSVTWNGKNQTPAITVKFYGHTLKNNTHYTISYSNNKEPGKAVITVKGKGLFGKTKKTAQFTINKANRTLTVSNLIKPQKDKGKSFAITVKTNGNSGVDKPKTTFKSGNTSVAALKGNKATLKKTGYSEITVTVAATKHYKAATKKVLAVLQGTQSITLNCIGLKKDKAADTYVASGDVFAKSLGVKALDGAEVSCAVSSVSSTADAWINNGDKLTAKGKGTVKIKVTAKESKHHVYPKSSRTITVKLNGFALYNKTWGYSQNSDGTVTLTKYYGSDAKVNVPSSLKVDNKAKKVTALGSGLFKGKTAMTSVTLPDSLTKIGANAFEGCTKLASVQIPDAVTSIGASAFSGCTSLSMLRFPENLTSISDNMLKNCRSMKGEMYLPLKVTSIGTGAFQGCTGITKVHVFGYLKKIGQNAFSGCSGIGSAAYAGTRNSWKKISWGAGNDILKNCGNITYYVYGPADTYGDVTMSEDDFISQHADKLENIGISQITNELEDETFAALSSASGKDIALSALKSQLDAGKPDVRAMIESLTDSHYTEDQLNKAIALELLQNMSEESWNVRESNEAELIEKIYGYFKSNEAWRNEFLSDGNKRYALARNLNGLFIGGTRRDTTEINNCLKEIEGKWKKIEGTYKTIGKAIDGYEFVTSWLLILQVNYDQILQLKQLVPEDSGLYTGLTILDQWYTKDLTSIFTDCITDELLNEIAKATGTILKKVADEIWNHHRFTASSYVMMASAGFKIVGKVFNVPSITAYNKAWLSVCNTKILKRKMGELRWQLANGQNDEATRARFVLAAKAYFASLRQQIKYASATLPKAKAADLNYRFQKYEPGLNYSSYIKATMAQYQGQ